MCVSNEFPEGICSCDPGSPLAVGNHLVGVALTKENNICGGGRPDVYTRVSSFVDWINTIVDQ